MSSFIIRSSAGARRAESPAIEYKGEWMGECYVSLTVKSPSPVAFEIGDYVDYRGERFELNYKPSCVKQAARDKSGDAFVYENIKFNSLSDELTRCDFLDVALQDNEIHYTLLPTFSFYAASVRDLADRIQANLDRLYVGDKAWTVEVHPEYAEKTNVSVSASGLKVWDALALSVSEFGCYFVIRGRTITIGTAGLPTTQIFKYGKGRGLRKIEEQTEDSDAVITRLRAYGNTRNMPARYYNKILKNAAEAYLPNNMAVSRLMLPGFPQTTTDPRVDSANIAIYGVREATVMFDGSDGLEDIYPSLEEMTAEQLVAAGVELSDGTSGRLDEIKTGYSASLFDGELQEGDDVPEFIVEIKDVGFDINDCLTSETAKISMKDGMCGGREFEISKCEKTDSGTYRLALISQEDTSLGLCFPNKFYPIAAGDKFVLLGIEMPEAYIQAASQRLLEAAEAYLAKNDKPRSVFQPEVDAIFMARQHDAFLAGTEYRSLHDTIKEGDLMLFEDEDLSLDANIVIDSLVIKEKEDEIPTYEVVLRQEKSVGALEKIQNQIDSLAKGGSGMNTSQVSELIKAVGKLLFLSKVNPDTAQGLITFLKGLVAQGDATFEASAKSDNFIEGIETGSGWRIDRRGNAEAESLTLRSWLEVPELRFNRATVLLGDQWQAPGGGIVESVTVDTDAYGNPLRTGTITLKLEEGEIGAIEVDDICKGYFHNFAKTSENATADTDDSKGNTEFAGFCTVYFRVTEIVSTDSSNKTFKYMLRAADGNDGDWAKSHHPFEAMHFVAYGNFTNAERQRSAYQTRAYTRYLIGVDDWEFDEHSIAMQFGNLDNLQVFGLNMAGYSAYLQNIYFSGTLEHIEIDAPYEMTAASSAAGFLIAEGETMTLTCTVKKAWRDVTADATSWTIKRDSGDADADAAWNASHQMTSAAFTLSQSDIGATSFNANSLFEITASGESVITGEAGATTVERWTATKTVAARTFRIPTTLSMRFESEYGINDTFVSYGDTVRFQAVIEDGLRNAYTSEYDNWSIVRHNGDTADDIASDGVWNATRAAISSEGAFSIEWSAQHDDLQAERATFIVTATKSGASPSAITGILSI